MSIKDLFDKRKKPTKTITSESFYSGSKDVESQDYIVAKGQQFEEFIPHVDFSTASNFAKYGSAELYYDSSFKRIYQRYPYDGTLAEKQRFELSSSYLDKYVFDNLYPRTNGFVSMSHGGWGTVATANDFPTPTNQEYITILGGPHTASNGMATIATSFSASMKYDLSTKRGSSLAFDLASSGSTVEFWLKRGAFSTSPSVKNEVVFDLSNGGNYSSHEQSRLVLYLVSGSSTTTTPFKVTIMSGSVGVSTTTQTLDVGSSSDISQATLIDGTWRHFALTLKGNQAKFYVNGNLSTQTTLGATYGDSTGSLNARLGALQSPVAGLYEAGGGKLAAAMDEFRYWKTERTGRQISNDWFIPVGGGTNNSTANQDLGVYFKFNEGVTGVSATDSSVLDYSGRITNGVWTGYSAGARDTGSALVLSGKAASEFKDPIIYSSHPDVSSSMAEYKTSGSMYDLENTSMFYNLMPSWLTEEDTESGEQVKYLCQIMGSYFDTLHSQIGAVNTLKSQVYPSSSYKAIPFVDRMLKDKGFSVSENFVDATIIEKFFDKDNNEVYEKSLNEVKNLIYHNIYNNLLFIYKSKGTEKSFRNLFRCYGIDSELIKLNLYADDSTFVFKDNYEYTSIEKRYVDFNDTARFGATVFQTASATDTANSKNYIWASSAAQIVSASFTYEAEVIFPKKLKKFETGYFPTTFLSSSIYGFHNPINKAAIIANNYTWSTTDKDVRVYAVRTETEGDYGYFVATGSFGALESSVYKLYDNTKWNLALRLKPEKFPIADGVVGTGGGYTFEFYGVETIANNVINEFTLTNTAYTDWLAVKVLYAGANRTNFTGSLLQSSDVKISSVRWWQSYLDNDTIKTHAYDASNFGVKNPYRSDSMFQNLDADATPDNPNIHVPQIETLALHWDFATITTSDASGDFEVPDASSGSAALATRYGPWMGEITQYQHLARGTEFPANNTKVVDKNFVYSAKQRQPEVVYSSDMVTLMDDEKENFFQDPDVSDAFFSFEKSMYGVISEEMLKTFATVVDFNNLIGEPTNRYRHNYKQMEALRYLFFEKVSNDPDIDKFTTFYKWIDSSVSTAIEQLYPASARFSEGVRNMVESHVLERSKYAHKLPTLARRTATEGIVRGSEELNYNWEFGHAPVDGADNKNCLWQKEREERKGNPGAVQRPREKIRQILRNDTSARIPILLKDDGTTYQGSAYALRRLSKSYRLEMETTYQIHAGTNYSHNKNREFFKPYVDIFGATGIELGTPQNAYTVGLGTGSGTQAFVDCLDDLPTKRKYAFTVNNGRVGNDSYVGKFKGEQWWPFNLMSGTLTTGYNSIISSGFKSDVTVANVHSDTYSNNNDIGMQGPFTETWVGGHQSRHVSLNIYDSEATFNSPVAVPVDATAATAQFVVTFANISDGETISINDGDGAVVYEWDTNGSVGAGNTQVVRGANGTEALPALKAAIEAVQDVVVTLSSVTSGGGNVAITNNTLGTAGNFTIANGGSDDTISSITTNAGTNLSYSAVYNQLHDHLSRPEAWRLRVGEMGGAADGAMGFVGPDYGSPYPHVARKFAIRYRDERTKRPVNIRNIRYTTASTRIGNYKENYEIINTSGRKENNIILRRSTTSFLPRALSAASTNRLPATTNPISKVSVFPNASNTEGPVFISSGRVGETKRAQYGWDGTNAAFDFVNEIPDRQNTGSNSVISTKFAAPGGPEISSIGYMDVYSAEYSPYNAMPWRNRTVLNDSGAPTSMRVVDHLGKRRGLNTLLSTHCGKQGLDSIYGSPVHSVFNGNLSGSYVDIGNAGRWHAEIGTLGAGGTRKMTFSTWINQTATGHSNFPRLFQFGDADNTAGQVWAYLNTSGYLYFSAGFSTQRGEWKTTTGAITAGEWTHVAITYNGTATTNNPVIYVNGVSQTVAISAGSGFGIPTGSYQGIVGDKCYIGNRATFNRVFYGGIDEFAIWNSILSETQIKEIYNNGQGKSLTNLEVRDTLRGWYRMGDGLDTNTRIHDMSGRGYHSENTNQIIPAFLDESLASYHKQHRNVGRKPTELSDNNIPVFNYDHDNAFMSHAIPRSDFQYSWINSALGDEYSVESGQQVIYGHAPASGEVSSSSGFVPAITFPSASNLYGE